MKSHSANDRVSRIASREESLDFLLKKAHTALKQATARSLQDLNVTVRELSVLRLIAQDGAASQHEAAAVLDIDRTTMVALLDELERKRFIERRVSERDRRRNIVVMTKHGSDVFRQATKRYKEVENSFTALIGDAGQAELRHLLQHLLNANTPSRTE